MTSVVCLDASVIAKWFLPEPLSNEARTLAATCAIAGIRMVAPPVVIGEVASAFHQRVRTGAWSVDDAAAAMALLDQSLLEIEPRRDVAVRALRISAQLQQKYPYDAFYLALAESLDSDLWTADGVFHSAAVGRYPRVRLLADYPVP